MTKEDEYHDLIKSYFSDYKEPADHSFKSKFRTTMNSFIEQLFHIIVKYFNDYSEEEFHRRMLQTYTFKDTVSGTTYTFKGFDFLYDWKKYHKPKLLTAAMTIRMNKWWLTFEEEKIYNIIIKLLQTKGWKLLPHEDACIKINVRRIHNFLFKTKDTIEHV